MPRTKPTPAEEATARTVPLGPRAAQLIAIAYRCRRPVLLEGPPGVGKSEIVAAVAQRLGIDCTTIDLGLCEPSDLVGLPRVAGDRTEFVPPATLPQQGQGLLVFEELNRAERFVQGPVLQLLSARRLNSYELPPDWSCVACVNPDDGANDVRELDPAMRSRFLHLPVRADRREWLTWARENEVDRSIVRVVETHSEVFDSSSPRSWTYVSQVLGALSEEERQDRGLLHDLLTGYLPDSWAVLLAETLGRMHGEDLVALDLLARLAGDTDLQQRVDRMRATGRTDVLRALAQDVQDLLRSPVEAARMMNEGQFCLQSFEALLARLPGDLREPCQDALLASTIAPHVMQLDYGEMLRRGYHGRGYDWDLMQWQREALLRHRAHLFVTGLCEHVKSGASLQSLRRANSGRRVLGRVLGDLRPELREQLLHQLASLDIEPILPHRQLPLGDSGQAGPGRAARRRKSS